MAALVDLTLFRGTQGEQFALAGTDIGPYITLGIEDNGESAALVVDLETARQIRDELASRITFAEAQS